MPHTASYAELDAVLDKLYQADVPINTQDRSVIIAGLLELIRARSALKTKMDKFSQLLDLLRRTWTFPHEPVPGEGMGTDFEVHDQFVEWIRQYNELDKEVQVWLRYE